MATHDWPRIRPRRTKVKGKSYSYWLVDCGHVDGKRVTITCKTKKEADLAAERKRIERNKIGLDALRLTENQKKDAVKAFSMLGDTGSLTDAVSFFLAHQSPEGGQKTVSELFQEYIESKIRANRRPRTISDIRHRIGKLAEDFGDTPIHEITAYDLESWLDKKGYQETTRANFRRLFTGFFNYALKRKLIKSNPAIAIERPLVDEKLPEIFTPEEVGHLLSFTSKSCPDMLPYFAVAIFAGIRPAELRQLDWKDVDLAVRRIRIIPETAKKRRQRYVDVSDNLAGWIKPFQKESGFFYFSKYLFESVRVKGDIRWASDICRHTYGSYHLAMHENAALTSLQMGHSDSSVLFNHYRDLVTREDARRFWEIWPEKMGQSGGEIRASNRVLPHG